MQRTNSATATLPAFSTEPHALIVDKPWGHEVIFTPAGAPYCGKILHVHAGKRLSLQIHDQKQETIMLLHGHGILVCDDADGNLVDVTMEPRKGYTIVPGQRHRLVAVTDCDFVESSMPEVGTTYRLEDDAGRGDETEAARAQERGATS